MGMFLDKLIGSLMTSLQTLNHVLVGGHFWFLKPLLFRLGIELLGRGFVILCIGKLGVSQVITAFILLLHTVGQEEEEENGTKETNYSTGYYSWREQERELKSPHSMENVFRKSLYTLLETRLTCQHLCPLPQILWSHLLRTFFVVYPAAMTINGHNFILNDLILVAIVFGRGPLPSVQTVIPVGFFGDNDVGAESGGFSGRQAAGTSSPNKPVSCWVNSRHLEEWFQTCYKRK